jgi:enoyl-CoA hydratase
MNALSEALCADVVAAVALADRDPEVRVIVVRGASDRAFSAGYDLTEETAEFTGIEQASARLNRDLRFTLSVWDCTKPTIAMIHGYCYAGGLEFAQMHDLRYCADDAQFAVIETRFSAGIATLVMPWILGARSRELIYSGDVIDAQEAFRIGLVNRVFPKADLEREVMKIAGRMSRVALATLQWDKRAINHSFEASGFRTALAYGVEACATMVASGSPEMAAFDAIRREEGLAAAFEWRRRLFAPYE